MKKTLIILFVCIATQSMAQWNYDNQSSIWSNSSGVGINTSAPFSTIYNKGLHISHGNHSTLMLGDPVSGGYGGVIQTSDNRHRVFIGANLYDDPTLSWRNFQSGKGGAGISIIADYNDWGTGIDFYTSSANNQVTSRMWINHDGNIGIGTSNPSARLHVHEQTLLGSAVGNFQLLNRVSGLSGLNQNLFMQSQWLLRDANGTDWSSVRLHDGISIDGSFKSPGADTRTWWERDPMNNIQSWGHGNQTYVTINEGNVGVGTSNPTSKLTVNGSVYSKEVKVDLNVPGPDYVFEPDYNLLPLSETETYIKQNKHLPEVPSAKEMETNGIQLGEMNMLLLKKVEELTLHMIRLEKDNIQLKQEIENLKSK